MENLIHDWKATSQVSFINSNAGIKPVKVDRELLDLTERALMIAELTKGALPHVRRKREIFGSIFPEKLTFDGFHFRTTRMNEVVRLIYLLDAGFSENKKGQNGKNPSCPVRLAYLDSNQDKQNQNLSYYHYTIGQYLL